jgi:Spy/CpxP family protein refolding chaperone
MVIQLTKRLLALALVFVCLFFSVNVPVAEANHFFPSPREIFTTTSKNTHHTLTFSEDDLTPQEHQEIQAVRQRRNRDIAGVLDLSQRRKLTHELHSGKDLDSALDAVNLDKDQKELINAIIELTNLKMKAIVSHHALLEEHQ